MWLTITAVPMLSTHTRHFLGESSTKRGDDGDRIGGQSRAHDLNGRKPRPSFSMGRPQMSLNPFL